MENLNVMVTLFIIVILGYALNKLGYLNENFDKKLSAIVVDVTCPLLILSSVMGNTLPDRRLILPLLATGFFTYIPRPTLEPHPSRTEKRPNPAYRSDL
jgi:predicted permease